MATVIEDTNTTTSKAMVAVSILILLAGVFGYYYFSDQAKNLEAAGSMFAGAILGAVVFFQSAKGKQLWNFGRVSFREMKKVVWPTPNEAFQTTLIVIAFCLLMGGFFWSVDLILIKSIQFINGLGG